MFLRKVYSMLLTMYPADFRAQFAGEMVAVFEQAAAQHRDRGEANLWIFVAREIFGLFAGAAREWVLHSDSSRTSEHPAFPSDIAGTEEYLEVVSRRLITAIANHDFANARYYDEQDRKARALLAQLRAQPN